MVKNCGLLNEQKHGFGFPIALGLEYDPKISFREMLSTFNKNDQEVL